MTLEKQESLRLINLFSNVGLQTRSEGVECAKLCVDEIINAIDWHDYEVPNKDIEYWQKVKKAIEQYENLQNIML